ncbi:MAG: cytochrome c family protein [Rhizobiaceae bacterium]
MNSYEWNKIFGALLAMAFVFLSVKFLSESFFHSENPEKQGYAIEGGTGHGDDHTKTAEEKPAEAAAIEPVAGLLASVDLAAGQKVAKKCIACHSLVKGGKNKVGPVLYGIVNRPIASFAGYSYSKAMVAYGADKKWTYAELNGFLLKPKKHIKGNKMGFAGIKKVAQRASLIGYLRSLADTPAPLPEG